MCYATGGVIDPVTSALHIIVGKKLVFFQIKENAFVLLMSTIDYFNTLVSSYRRLSGFGRLFGSLRLRVGAILSVSGGLWILWRCTV